MNEERRQNTLDNVLTGLGELKAIADSTSRQVSEINARVAIQNGRVSKLEEWKNKAQGSLNVIIVLMLPVGLYIAYEVIKRLHF